ncbi:DUF3810 domain-containing protein [Solitalea lacus]|uniref:DUF3810 domain-containing protein n=1 Tax=Solitalea lacus TaxID=2911172 RepID=UPI001EDBEC2E|nr:DUF3810 domain-containing protein [Solitalea lacus]UKJ06304.1 DUF3810 domain-containing protein [Solitalea lacus]
MSKQFQIACYKVLTLLLIFTLFRILSRWSFFIDHIYHEHLYKAISTVQRLITGWLPFSFGDILYTIIISIALIGIIRYIKHLIKQKENRFSVIGLGFLNSFSWIILAYLIFQLLWGFNYFRQPLSEQLNLNTERGDKEQLHKLAQFLAAEVNKTHLQLTGDSLKQYRSNKGAQELYAIAQRGYQQPDSFSINYFSTKTSVYNILMNYAGIAGYYNPFSGEAQVNTNPPQFTQPFTICHEIAHQTGISAEEEANFVGYLTALKTNNSFFKYSAQLEAFIYTASELGRLDSVARKQCYLSLNKGVRADLKEYRAFWRKYENAVEPYIEWYYDWFLKSNNQPKGIRSYNEFVNLLLGYYQHNKKGDKK